MNQPFRISDAANLALHATAFLSQQPSGNSLKLNELAKLMKASQAHLAKVMNRLAQEQVVLSRRGPSGGFVLNPKAKQTTLLEIYEIFDGPLTREKCLLGFSQCPMGGCVFGEPIQKARNFLKKSFGKKTIADLSA